MESETVTEMPKSNRGMTQEALQTLETLKNMEVNEIKMFKDGERPPKSVAGTLKNLMRRLPRERSFTIRKSTEAVYVRRDEDKFVE